MHFFYTLWFYLVKIRSLLRDINGMSLFRLFCVVIGADIRMQIVHWAVYYKRGGIIHSFVCFSFFCLHEFYSHLERLTNMFCLVRV